MILFLPAFIIICQNLSVFGDKVCQDSGKCQKHLGSKGRCQNELCGCVDHYYLSQWDDSGSNSSCTQCPGIGESCAEMQCCNARYLDCQSNVCVCFNSEYCWDADDAQHVRLERIAQCVLGAALILTGVILFVLFLRTCSSRRREIREASSRDRFPSLNSIQRFVLMQLQDRPPPYGHDCAHWKYASDLTEPPPSYIEAIGLSDQSGEENLVFVLGEDALPRLSASSLLVSMSSGMPQDTPTNLAASQGAFANMLPSTSQTSESGLSAGSIPISRESVGFLPENDISDLPLGVPVAMSASGTSTEDVESLELTSANSGSGKLNRFQESKAPANRTAHTQNDLDPTITPTSHQCRSSSLVTANVEIHM